MTIELESMAVEMPEVEGHPNRVAFRGVLTVVDIPSDRAPSGSHGKRVVLTRRAAEKAIPSLIGMAVDYSPSLDQHDQKRKIGVITRAELAGRNLEVGGYLFRKDFPEIVNEIDRGGRQGPSGVGLHASESRIRTPGLGLSERDLDLARQNAARSEGARLRACLTSAVREIRAMLRGRPTAVAAPIMLRAEAASRVHKGPAPKGAERLGMSFEVTNVNVLNPNARILRLIDVTFTGAAILRRDKAAYQDTWIELN